MNKIIKLKLCDNSLCIVVEYVTVYEWLCCETIWQAKYVYTKSTCVWLLVKTKYRRQKNADCFCISIKFRICVFSLDSRQRHDTSFITLYVLLFHFFASLKFNMQKYHNYFKRMINFSFPLLFGQINATVLSENNSIGLSHTQTWVCMRWKIYNRKLFIIILMSQMREKDSVCACVWELWNIFESSKTAAAAA